MKKKIQYAEQDFQASDLPANRRKQGQVILKNHWRNILSLSLLTLIPSFLLVGVLVWEAATLATFSENLDSLLAVLLFDLLKIIPFILFCLIYAGMGRVYRVLSYDEGLLFWPDFWKGVKQNGKALALFGFFFGLANAFPSALSYLFYRISFTGTGAVIIDAIAVGFAYVAVLPVLAFAASQSTVYSLKTSSLLNNGIRFFLKGLGWSLLFSLLPLGLRLLQLITSLPVVYYGLILAAFFFLSPFYCLLWHQFAFSCFDALNKDHYPDYYRKGLRPGK